MHLHAKVGEWSRDEQGSYEAHIGEWELVVKWRPESPDEPRGFWYEAKGPDGKEIKSEVYEEIEHAMAYAEQLASPPEGAPKSAS